MTDIANAGGDDCRISVTPYWVTEAQKTVNQLMKVTAQTHTLSDISKYTLLQMEQKQHSSKAYEDKGLKRHMVIIKPETLIKLKALAKQHGIIQGEVIDVILNEGDMDLFSSGFIAVRAAKVAGRNATPQAAIKGKLKEATPEQLAEIQRILAGR